MNNQLYNARVMIVDDGPQSENLSTRLEGFGYSITGIYPDLASVMSSLEGNKPDVMIMAIELIEKPDDIDTANKIQTNYNIPVVLQLSHFDDDRLRHIIQNNIFSYLLMPVQDHELKATLEITINHQKNFHLLEQEFDKKYKDQLGILSHSNVRSMLMIDAIQRQREAEDELHKSGNYKKFYKNVLYDIMLLTNSKYGALGIFNTQGQLDEFITLGMTESQINKISNPPKGEGLLSAIYQSSEIIIVDNISQHPDSCGFPQNHPPMTTLIGAPVSVNEKNRGVIYLAEKSNAQKYTFDDEALIRFFSSELAHVLERHDLLEALNSNKKILESEKSEQKKLIEKLQGAQEQLLQSEKMASIGQLAAGVAHEINNPVGYINSNISTLKNYIDDILELLTVYEQSEENITDQNCLKKIIALKKQLDLEYLKHDIQDLIKESNEGVVRVKQIVQDLKDFSHVDEAEWQWADIHKALDSTLNIVHNELKYKADILKEYGKIPEIECIVSQLNQVFMNLFVNAAHAIETRGEIKIATYMEEDNVIIQVSDNGKGISEDKLKRIFDPFFTTKPVGQGTGLGLSLSYSIIKKHNGSINVQSKIGEGTTFFIKLPVRQEMKMAEG